MKGKSLIVLLLTVVALALLVWEISHSLSSPNKNKKVVAEKEKPVVTESAEYGATWKHYTFEKSAATDAYYDKIISTFPKADTLYPSDITPVKQFMVFPDTASGKRICIFRPTSPDGKYGEWIVLADSAKIFTKFTAVKIDTVQTMHSNKKVIVFKKEKTNAVSKDTIGL